MFNSLRIIIFLLFVLVNILLCGIIHTITFSFGSKIQYLIANYFHKFFLLILGINIKVNKKKDYSNKNYMIICNHYTALDYFILRILFPNSYTVVKSDMLRANTSIFIKILLLPLQYLFFNQGMLISYVRGNTKSGLECQKDIIEKIKSHNIIIFPEGTSTRNGIPKSFKKGLFYTAYKNKIPIIPISLKYKKDIGINPGDKLNLSEWINETAKLEIHDEINPEDFNNIDELHKHSFEVVAKKL